MLGHVTPRTRAEPLSPEERRRVILEAITPLLLEHGVGVTTSRMAMAAGVAEGTIFRVFPDKVTLLHEALRASLDPEPVLRRLAGTDQKASLEERLRLAAGVLAERISRVHALMSVVRSIAPSGSKTGKEALHEAREANSRILAGLTRLLEGCSPELSVAPDRAAAALNGLIFAIHFPFSDPRDRIGTDEAVSILLHGIGSRASRERERR